jgi:hypothetical protein
MWRSITSADKVAVGEIVRHLPTSHNLPLKGKIFRVIKIEQHYFIIEEQPEGGAAQVHITRQIVKLMDIGYHVGLQVWTDEVALPSAHERVETYK